MNDHQQEKKPPSLSVVMPYYNEESNAERSLADALKYLKNRVEDFEVIAVDDRSTDRTLAILQRMREAEPRVKVIALPQNTRFAGALKTGFAAAEKEYIFYTDGDCPIDYNEIDRALERLGEFDAVIGYRTSRDREGSIRKVYTCAYRFVLRVLFGIRFRDVNFSFKLFPRKALQSITIESTGSFIDAEILFKLKQAGVRIGEIPVKYFSRRQGRSTLASPGIILKIFREMLCFKMTHKNKRLACARKDAGLERPEPVDCQRR